MEYIPCNLIPPTAWEDYLFARKIPEDNLGREVKIVNVNKRGMSMIQGPVKEFCVYFDENFEEVTDNEFSKIVPLSHRPYGRIYVN